MTRKLRLSSILFVLGGAIALMVLFIVTCVRKRSICWAFLSASVVEFIAGGYLFGLYQHEARTAKRGEAYLDAEFEELEHGSCARRTPVKDSAKTKDDDKEDTDTTTL